MVSLIESHGLSIDLVSGGELYTAKQANFSMENAIIHGNNKSMEELRMAITYNAGLIIVDSIYELQVLIELSNELKTPVRTLLRVNFV